MLLQSMAWGSHLPTTHSIIPPFGFRWGACASRLAEYYRTEGKNDPMIVDLPKGRFRLTFEERSSAPTFNQEGSPGFNAARTIG